jgi:hypothetical protein
MFDPTYATYVTRTLQEDILRQSAQDYRNRQGLPPGQGRAFSRLGALAQALVARWPPTTDDTLEGAAQPALTRPARERELRALWQEVGTDLTRVAHTGTPAQRAAVRVLLVTTRRKLDQILAGEPFTHADGA